MPALDRLGWQKVPLSDLLSQHCCISQACPYIIRFMAEIVNLRRARKQKARAEAETEAAAKRLTHGRTKSERNQTRAEQEAAERKLDGHKRGDDDE